MNKKYFFRLTGAFFAGVLCLPQAFLPQHNRRPGLSSFDTLAPQVKISAANFSEYFFNNHLPSGAEYTPAANTLNPLFALEAKLNDAQSEEEIVQTATTFLKQIFGAEIGMTYYLVKQIRGPENRQDFFFRTVHREGMQGLRYYLSWVKMPDKDEKSSCLSLTWTFKKTTFLHITDRSVNPNTHKPFVLSDIFLYMNNDEIKELTNRLESKDDSRELISYINTHNIEPKILADFFKTYENAEKAADMIQQINSAFPELVDRINESLNFSIIDPENNRAIAHILLNNWSAEKPSQELLPHGRKEEIFFALSAASAAIANALTRVTLTRDLKNNRAALLNAYSELEALAKTLPAAISFVHDIKNTWAFLGKAPEQVKRFLDNTIEELTPNIPFHICLNNLLDSIKPFLDTSNTESAINIIQNIEQIQIPRFLNTFKKLAYEPEEDLSKRLQSLKLPLLSDNDFEMLRGIIRQQKELLGAINESAKSLSSLIHNFLTQYEQNISSLEKQINNVEDNLRIVTEEKVSVTGEDLRHLNNINEYADEFSRSWARVKEYLENFKKEIHSFGRQDPAHSLSISAVDLSAFMPKIIETAASASWPITHTLVLDCEDGLSVMTDPDVLGRLLINLIDNARKYSPVSPGMPQKTIWVSARYDPKTQKIAASVKDEGLGIDQETIKNIEQHEPTRGKFEGSEEIPGSGVGLAFLLPKFTEAGGAFTLKSEGNGTEFILILPPATTPQNNYHATKLPETLNPISEQVIAQSI